MNCLMQSCSESHSEQLLNIFMAQTCKKRARHDALISFIFLFLTTFCFILLRICDDFFLIYDALYGGASEKVQTSANTKKEQEIPGSTKFTLLLGPVSLHNDIIILCQWTAAVLHHHPCDTAPPQVQYLTYRLSDPPSSKL